MHNQPVSDNINIDDSVMVRRCQEGDLQALSCLIVRYQDRLYNAILKICGNRDDAAELTQQTFVKVIENIGDFEGKSSFYTWLFRIGVNLAINFCKRRIHLGMWSLDESAGPEYGSACRQLRAFLADEKAAEPAAIAENREAVRILTWAISMLDDDQRTVIVLRDIEGMGYSEIAETLNVELGTVKSRLSRARNNLRQMLETVL